MRIVIRLIGVAFLLFFIVFMLGSEKTLLTHPKGIIAQKELHLITMNYLLMSLIVIPTFIALFWVAWKYRADNKKAKYEPEVHSKVGEALLWVAPACIVAVLALMLWRSAHELDPYQPIKNDKEALAIQVVSLDWKWLFIYPEQGIATLNFVKFPEKTPIHLTLTADGSPMNSFWLPELSGQIYAMAGMATTLYLMADGLGVYEGRAAEINGEGFAKMTFVAESSSQEDFDAWVASVKATALELNYEKLAKPSIAQVALYSNIEPDLFKTIMKKYM